MRQAVAFDFSGQSHHALRGAHWNAKVRKSIPEFAMLACGLHLVQRTAAKPRLLDGPPAKPLRLAPVTMHLVHHIGDLVVKNVLVALRRVVVESVHAALLALSLSIHCVTSSERQRGCFIPAG